MAISHIKKDFLGYLAGGLSTLMDGSMLSDEIYTCQNDDVEIYIKNEILRGSSFCENRFCEALKATDDGTLRKIFNYFDDRDMDISRVYIESCLTPGDLPEHLRAFAESIDYKDVCSFEDFLDL